MQVLSTSSAYIQWTQPGEPRGDLVKYQVVLDGTNVAYETDIVEPASLNVTLTGLKANNVRPLLLCVCVLRLMSGPVQLYEVTIVAYTSAGASVPSLEAKLETPKKGQQPESSTAWSLQLNAWGQTWM